MGTVPTIPGHASAEWSSILPAILGGDAESAPVSLPVDNEVNTVVQDTKQEIKIPEKVSSEPEIPPQKPAEVEPQEETAKPIVIESPTASVETETVQKPVKEDLKPAKKPEEEKEPAVISEAKPLKKEPEKTPEIPMIPVPVITAENTHPTMKDPSVSEEKPVYQILNTISADDVKNKTSEKDEEQVEVSAGNLTEKKPMTDIPETKKPAASIPETMETEVTPNKSEENAEKMATASPPNNVADKVKEEDKMPDAVLKAPSIILEAPSVPGDTPVEIQPPVVTDKPTEVVEEPQPTAESDKIKESPTPAEGTTEKATMIETVEENVSEIVDGIPEAINSIVNDLISESANKVPEKLDEKIGNEKPQAAPEETKIKEEEKIEVTIKEPEKSDVPALNTPTKTDAETETVFEMLPEITPERTTTTAPEVVTPLEKIESKPETVTTLAPESSTSLEKVEQQLDTTTKTADSKNEVTESLIPVKLSSPEIPRPDLQPPAVPVVKDEEESSGSEPLEVGGEKAKEPIAAEDKKPETLLTELADSVSSMISQISETLPSMVPIPQKSEDNDQSMKRVEDTPKPVTTTITNDPTMPETPMKISAEKAEIPEDTSKPIKNEPEMQIATAKEPVPTKTELNIESQKPEAPVQVELPVAVATEMLNKPEVPSKEAEIEKVEIALVDDEIKSEKPEAGLKNEDVVPEGTENLKPEAAAVDTKKEERPESNGSSDSEAPIVRIDIAEAKPTDISPPAVSTDANNDSTESPVVRIQITNPVAAINQILETAPALETSSVNVEAISLPEINTQTLTAQNIGSSLIAGPQPENPTGVEPLKESSSSVSTSNIILENLIPSAGDDSKTETNPSAETIVANNPNTNSKPEIETENTKIPVVEIPQTMNNPETSSEADKEGDEVKSPATSETEVQKTPEESSEPKPAVEEESGASSPNEKVQESEVPPATAESMIKVDLPVSTEKIEPAEKPKQETPVPSDTDKIIEPSDVSTAVDSKKESAIPPEVVISTTVDVLTAEDKLEKIPESIDNGSEKTPITEEKPEAINKDSTQEPSKDSTKTETAVKMEPEVSIAPQKSETKPEINSEAENTATKIGETQAPAVTQPNVQSSVHVGAVSTEASESVEMELNKNDSDKTNAEESLSSSQQETKTPESQDNVLVESQEAAEKEAEVSVVTDAETPAAVVSTEVKGSVDSVAEPELIKVPEIEIPSKDVKPEGEMSSEMISPAEDVLKEKEATKMKPEETSAKPVAPVVRIDMSPEKNQPETSPTLDISLKKPVSDKPDKESSSTEDDEKVATSSMSEEKLPEKSEDTSAAEVSIAQVAVPETTSISEASSIEPAKTESSLVQADIKKDETQPIAPKEPEAAVPKTPETGVQEIISTVDSKLPVSTIVQNTPVESTPIEVPSTKIEAPETPKPVLKIDASTPVKTEEIRVQVNDTAVRVTKKPVSQEVSKVPENEEKKTETPTSTMEKIEVPSPFLQPAKEPSEIKPETGVKEVAEKKPEVASDGKNEEVDKMSVQDAAASGLKKKPVIDPYVKLGETLEDSGSKKPSFPIDNKDPEDGKLTEEKWTLIPQSESRPGIKTQVQSMNGEPASPLSENNDEESQQVSVPLEAHQSAVSLAESIRNLDKDIESFSSLCNELAFSFWSATNKGLSTARSLALSPFGMTSMLAMVFLGARGPTSGQMNDILKLDDVVTFNPHLVFQNVSDSVNLARGQGIANAAFVRELFSDKLKAGRLLPFYKERAQQFYDGHVEEVNFATISDLVRRRTNLLIRRQTGGRIRDFVKGNVMPLRSPLAALSANVFQTDCAAASSQGRDGEMYFAVLPAVRQRKLVPVPATVWKSGVLAGYEPGLDATVIALGSVDALVSTIFLLPGQQGLAAPGDSLDHLERRLLEGAFTHGVWNRLLKSLIPRVGLEVQVPKFSHRSIVNATAALKRMGLEDLFSKHADLKGINGVGNDLHLADMLQVN